MAVNAVGIIGGTGLPSPDAWTATHAQVVDTPYGPPSAPPAVGELNNQRCVFMQRHGVEHNLAPHLINYRANLWALHQMGVDRIIAISAVGGISSQAKPADIVIPDQLIDYTYGREHTYFNGKDAALAHVDFTGPYSQCLRHLLIDAAKVCGVPCIDSGVYAAVQGPRLETAAEINRLERDGCTIVGMTGMPEAALARELGIDYACCAIVVNWAAGRSHQLLDMASIRQYVAAGEKKLKALLSVFLSMQPGVE